MRKNFYSICSLGCTLLFLVSILYSAPIHAQSQASITKKANRALSHLIQSNAQARALNSQAIAVLVFPEITKAGLMIGGQYGDGVLLSKGKAIAYYNTTGVSYGLQIGAQEYGYAMFFMKQSAIAALDSTEGFEVGVGPSIVVVDEGFAKSNTSINLQDDIYAFIFNQKGLMAGLGIQGNKITKVKR
jgi:lipid-binding SYLF domain-containing protein